MFGCLDPKTAISILYQLGSETGFLRRENRTAIISTYIRELSGAACLRELTSFLAESFDVASQLLVFEAGQISLHSNESVNFARVREALPSLVMPPELNPEEEHHKQLAGILRSRRIRESLANDLLQQESPLRSDIDLFNRFMSYTGDRKLVISLVCLMLVVCASENVPGTYAHSPRRQLSYNCVEYLMGVWMRQSSKTLFFPALCVLLGLVATYGVVLFMRYDALLLQSR